MQGLTATNERLQQGVDRCHELLGQPEDRTRRQLLVCEEDLGRAEDALRRQLRSNVGLREGFKQQKENAGLREGIQERTEELNEAGEALRRM